MLWDPSKDIDLSKPSLKGLAHLLRHEELWHEGFVWNWNSCSHCAMGLAETHWPEMKRRVFFNLFNVSHLGRMMRDLRVTKTEAYDIFYHNPGDPEQIADIIDRTIERRGGNI